MSSAVTGGATAAAAMAADVVRTDGGVVINWEAVGRTGIVETGTVDATWST